MRRLFGVSILVASLACCGGDSDPETGGGSTATTVEAPSTIPEGVTSSVSDIDFQGQKCEIVSVAFFPSSGNVSSSDVVSVLVDFVLATAALSPEQISEDKFGFVIFLNGQGGSGVNGSGTLVERKIDKGQNIV